MTNISVTIPDFQKAAIDLRKKEPGTSVLWFAGSQVLPSLSKDVGVTAGTTENYLLECQHVDRSVYIIEEDVTLTLVDVLLHELVHVYLDQ